MATAANTYSKNELLTRGSPVPVWALRRQSGRSFSHWAARAPSPASGLTFAGQRSRSNDPMVSFCTEEFLICFVAAVLIFFSAGLLYLLCLEHVDNLGAYSIPAVVLKKAARISSRLPVCVGPAVQRLL